MPKRTDLKKILIIGAGPIVIGQACEFDYSGTQACRALMAEGYEVVLINSNPATIMTDPQLASKTYIEPLTLECVIPILKKERPDAILPTMGGQTALNLTVQLYEAGVLKELGIETIGANYEAIEIAEDRQQFKELVAKVGLESLRSTTIHNLQEAHKVLEELGLPIILRPAFTLGGSGAATVFTKDEFDSAIEHALIQSPIKQVLLEESALGWKEYEFEVMRDCKDNVVIVCSVENVDPMGVHTGDSITVAPAQTLSDVEYQTLRNASIDIIRGVGVDAGGCNIQFAIHPTTGRVIVIEMNPRVSRSSALVSKATGVPIAKISAQLAVGKTLDEIANDITQNTPACFEPVIDYVVTKIPRFSFEKFPGANQTLSPQMKSVGEVMAIGATFQESFQKALRGLELGLDGFYFPAKQLFTPEEIKEKLPIPTAQRPFWVYQALKYNISIEEVHSLTGVDPWFLSNFKDIIDTENKLNQEQSGTITPSLLKKAKHTGFSDKQIATITKQTANQVREQRKANKIIAQYKAVDTCSAEFEAYTPYYYSTYNGIESELPTERDDEKVIIIGAGPNRIGQGLEFDYCCVHAALALKDRGYTAIMVNSNPETVSTDYDISSRLVFDPLTTEDIENLMDAEQPAGLITQFGGQTALGLAFAFEQKPFPFMGTTPADMAVAEDRDAFRNLLVQLGLNAPASGMAKSVDEATQIAQKVGFPIIARPSFVLGGRAMRIFYSEDSLRRYLLESIQVHPEHPVLIERFLEDAIELDVDAVCDGETTILGGIMEHIEHAGVHSGDSTCVWPPQSIAPAVQQLVEETTHKLAIALNVKGLLNIQFALKGNDLYVLEVNPRGSRTVPFICKATGLNLVSMAIDVMIGRKLKDMDMPERIQGQIAVKAPVFPFIKFQGADPLLGPEMKSTGEVMGVDEQFQLAFAKAQLAAGVDIVLPSKSKQQPSVFISVNDKDKPPIMDIARQLVSLGFKLIATSGTALALQQEGLDVEKIKKKHEGSPNVSELIQEGGIQLIINTPIGEAALVDDSYIRKTAVINKVPVITTISGAQAFLKSLNSLEGGQQYLYRALQETAAMQPVRV